MALTKGVRFTGMEAFIVDRLGSSVWEGLLATLPAADAAVVRAVEPSGWYDVSLRARLVRALGERRGAALVRDLGRFEADRDFTAAHRWVARLVPAPSALKNLDVYWRRTEDTGSWSVEGDGPETVARLHGWSVVEPALCGAVEGYLERMLRLLGSRDAIGRHTRCRAAGHAFCEFRMDGLGVGQPLEWSNGNLTPSDILEIALEIANLTDLGEVIDAIVAVLEGRLSCRRVALWGYAEPGGEARLLRETGPAVTMGEPPSRLPRCLVLQTGGVTVGRLEVDGPDAPADAQTLDQLLPAFAAALRKTGATRGARLDPGIHHEKLDSGERARRIASAATRWGLTPRERMVLDLVVDGLRNKEAASELGCQEGTVEVHVSKILRKSGAESRAGLVTKVWDQV